MGTKITPRLILDLLAFLGALAANALIAQGWEATLAQTVSILVINIGTALFWGLTNLLGKIGVQMEIITSIIQAVEEQMADKPGNEKLDLAMEMLEAKIATTKMGFFAKLFFRPFARFMISACAGPLKKLLYSPAPNLGQSK